MPYKSASQPADEQKRKNEAAGTSSDKKLRLLPINANKLAPQHLESQHMLNSFKRRLITKQEVKSK